MWPHLPPQLQPTPSAKYPCISRPIGELDKAPPRGSRRDSCRCGVTLTNYLSLSFLIRDIRPVPRARLQPQAWLWHLMPQSRGKAAALNPSLHPATVAPAVCGHACYLRSARLRLPPLETCRLGGPAPVGPALGGPQRPSAQPRRLPAANRPGLSRDSGSQSPLPPQRRQRRPQGYRQAEPGTSGAADSGSECFRRRRPRPPPWVLGSRESQAPAAAWQVGGGLAVRGSQ